jgi:hypothetical protein
VLCLLLAACSAGSKLPTSVPIQDAGDLLRALEQAGVDAAPFQRQMTETLGSAGSVWRIGGEEIQVYEFSSEAERLEVSGGLGLGGQPGDQPLPWPGRPMIWAVGRLIVVYLGVDGGLILLLDGLLGDPLTAAGSGEFEPYPPAVLAAMQALAEELGRPPQELQVLSYREMRWPDGCLGLPAADERCTQAVTPGWEVVLTVDGEEYQLRTDQLGLQVRRR